MMNTTELLNKIEELKDLEEMLHELTLEIDTIKDSLKQELVNLNTEELVAGAHIIRFTTVLSNRFDTKSFKEVMPDVYKAYTKQVTSKRFTVS